MLKKIEKTKKFIKKKISKQYEIAIVLGTGLGGLVEKIKIDLVIPYHKIPHFPISTVKGHAGQLIFGELAGKNVIAMQGRFHYYEGYTMKEITFPIRVMKALGVELLIISNAAGGMNPTFKVGDIMVIKDHINLMPSNPLIGKNYEELGPRFPDMSEPYDKALRQIAFEAGKELEIDLHEGVYVAVSGPTFETPAEYKYMRTIGGDAVGMSTVPEVIVARHANMRVFALSVITDLGGMDHVVPVSHEEVLEAAKNAEPKMSNLIIKMLSKI
ncbi:MAG: purine-nucleoside phosphorylase [Bacteroidales bacterium]|nr:purine-nucleoside phosphorylase [Bacteroidales bacterium]